MSQFVTNDESEKEKIVQGINGFVADVLEMLDKRYGQTVVQYIAALTFMSTILINIDITVRSFMDRLGIKQLCLSITESHGIPKSSKSE